ncbi:MAG: TRAP transporter large permease [Candidatus Accumulibacter sp.]|jgi:tripartite ATP-independent transporter DctM subunit|nr:TRAP transporter large permease [Accumulibacter sp.]
MTTDPIAITLLMGLFALLIIIKFPIAFSLALSAFVTAAYKGISLGAITQKMVAGVDSFSLLAIPFFILAGEIMGAGGISDRLVKLADVIVGRMRGGLALVNVVASMFFGGISGSAVADTSSLGPLEIDMMKKQGYDTDFSVCVTITSACQGVLIPPSHNMIIYAAAVGGLSVGKLFMAGLIPGILLGIALMVLCYIMSIRRNYPCGGKYTLREAVKIAVNSLLGLFTVVLIIGGVFTGIVTANESSVLACIWAFIVAIFFYKKITVRDVWGILKRTLGTLAMVMTLIAASSAFGYMMTVLRIPALITQGLLDISQNKIILLLLINFALLVLGCVMDMAPLILITAPILLPVVTSPVIGMDPVQFGIVMMLNLSVGLLTPPVGTVLFVGSSIGGIKIEQTAKAMLPFYITMVVVLMLLTFVPAISMTVPNLMFGK